MFRISCAMAEVGHIVGDVLPQLIRQAPRAGLEVSYHGGEFRGLSLNNGQSVFAAVTAALHFFGLRLPFDP